MKKNIFNSLVSNMAKYEKVGDPETYNVEGCIKLSEFGPQAVVNINGNKSNIPVSFNVNFKVDEPFTSLKVQKFRLMKEVSWMKFESNPDGDVVYRVIEYK